METTQRKPKHYKLEDLNVNEVLMNQNVIDVQITEGHKKEMLKYVDQLERFFMSYNNVLMTDEDAAFIDKSMYVIIELTKKEEFVGMKATNELLQKIDARMKIIEKKMKFPIAKKGREGKTETKNKVVEYATQKLLQEGKINIKSISKELKLPYSICYAAITEHNKNIELTAPMELATV